MLPCDPVMMRWLRSLVPRSQYRAKRAQLAHDLAPDHGMRLFQQQAGACAISGLPLSLLTFPDVLVKHPFAPSLDRISSSGGYTADNVRLVCIAVNFGMGQWGEELYLTFARAAVRKADMTAASPGGGDVTAWLSTQRERIAMAEILALTLSGDPLAQQKRRVSSLKRNLALGPAGLASAAMKAAQTRAR